MISSVTVLLLALGQVEVADEKVANAAVEAFKTAFKSPVEADRVKAVNTLAETIHDKTLTRLGVVVASTDGPAVRTAAAKGIATFIPLKKQAASVLARTLAASSKDPRGQVVLCQALGTLGDASALPAIYRTFEEKEQYVVRAALQAAGQIKNALSIDPVIATLTKYEKMLKANSGGNMVKDSGGNAVETAQSADFMKNLQDTVEAGNKALAALTGQDTINTSADWLAWWNRNRATFKPQ